MILALIVRQTNLRLIMLWIHFCRTWKKINASMLPIVAKVEAINMMVMSKFNFFLCNLTIPIVSLKSLEDNIVKYIRNWFGLNKSSNISCSFLRNSGVLVSWIPRLFTLPKRFLFFYLFWIPMTRRPSTALVHLLIYTCINERPPKSATTMMDLRLLDIWLMSTVEW